MARNQFELEKVEAIRKEIDSLLGGSLREKEWNDLVEEGYPNEIIRNPSTRSRVVAEAAEKVRRRRRIYGAYNEPKNQELRMLSEQETKQPTKRSEVISIFVAEEASEDAGVRLFRTEVLGDKLLPLEEVEEWIKQQSQKDGPPTIWLNNIPLPQAKTNELIKLIQGITPDVPKLLLEIPMDQVIGTMNLQAHVLKYPGLDEWARSISTVVGGVLEHLRRLSDRLAEKYKWSQAQATTFVLTGRIPLISSINATLKIHSRSLFSRIVLDVDPAMSPREIAMHYSRNRKEIMATRHRNLSEKHMQLALFDSKRLKTETWAIKMDEWNKTHPAEWKYEEVSNFAHDCLQSQRRLLRS